jgi:hypothetical protein
MYNKQMRTHTKLLLVALLQLKLANTLLWKLPLIYELHKSNGKDGTGTLQNMKKFTICGKNNDAEETGVGGKKILTFDPIEEPLDWDCGEISWDLYTNDNSTTKGTPNPKIEPEPYKSVALEPFNIAFLFV